MKPPLLRVRSDLSGAGEKHSDSESKKRTLSERAARKKLNNLVHMRFGTGEKRKNHMTRQNAAAKRANGASIV
jgi:hypothetical protein